MKENNNFFDFDDLFKQEGGGGRRNENEDHESCPVMPMIMSALMMPRPFGMMWDDEVIEKFLDSRGYKILDVTDETGENIHVAVKKDDPIIPDEPNIIAVFEKEVQGLFLNFLIKYGNQ